MNERQARTVRNFLETLLYVRLLNCWVEPSDEIVSDGWVVGVNFNNDEGFYIRTIAEMQAPEFWEKLLTVSKNPV